MSFSCPSPGPDARARDSTPGLSPHLFERYGQELALRNYSPRTVASYLSCLRRFTRWLAPRHPRAADSETVRGYLLGLADVGASRSLVSQSVSALKFLYVRLYLWEPDAFDVPRPRGESRLPFVPSRNQVVLMAERTLYRPHATAILLLYGSGLRLSELLALCVGDVDCDRLLLRVVQGKGRKDRLTLLSARLRVDLEPLLRDRSGSAPLFLARSGSPWSPRSVQKFVRRAAERADIPQRVTPHSLRHAFATHLLETGTDLRVIQGLLGHCDIRTTTRYTRMRDPNRFAVASPL